MTTTSLPDPEFFLLPGDSSPDDGFNHIVGRIQQALRLLRIKPSNALCGVPMVIDEARPIVTVESRPVCPWCAAKAGWQG